MRAQLADLPGMTARLELAVAAGRLPVHTLALLGPGSAELAPDEGGRRSDPRPRLRYWTTTEHRTVIEYHSPNPGMGYDPQRWPDQPFYAIRPVTVWHSEPVTRAAADDGVGSLPVAVWVSMWALRWRAGFGHRHPGEVDVAGWRAQRARAGDASVRHARLLAARSPDACAVFAYLHAVKSAARDHEWLATLGLATHDGPRTKPGVVDPDTPDPLDEVYRARFGARRPRFGLGCDVAYLDRWLLRAAETDRGIAAFAAELRALHAECTAALGETSDLVWLGQCPNRLQHDDGEELCAASLWHDPYASRVSCPRCRAEWVEREWLWLAARIRFEYPIDRRRRYSQRDRDGLRPVACERCGAALAVLWVEVTEPRRDRERFWRPSGTRCSLDCDERKGEAA